MRLRYLTPLLLILAAALLAPASASAGSRMETSIMDDQLLLNASPAALERDMALFRRLGVDRLRVSAFWNQIAPAAGARAKPGGFDGRNHFDPRYNWAPLDRAVASASRHGLRIMVSISTPAPVWASADPSRDNQLWKPSAAEFADFSEATVRRYASLVDHWGISNEPNQGVWLQPQSDRTGLVAPHLYRNMVLASYPRIKALDPTSTALVGELAASGRSGRGATRPIRPLLFLREMACRNSRWRPIRRGRCKGFRPVPVDALGHHPYNLLQRPTNPSRNKYDAAIGDGRRLTRTTDRMVRLGALKPGRGRRLSVFYTEFGYQTTPPDPFAGVSLNLQRLYLQQAAYIAQRTPRVRGLNQFRLTDGAIAGKGLRRFEEFQSGLMFRNRRPKPAYSVFAHPFVISGDRFWGQVRPGNAHTVRVQRRASRRGAWRLVAQVPTNRLGYFSFRLRGRRPGYYRYVYDAAKIPSGTVRVRR
ncbi:MAG TPA: hypothetical protein VEX39_02170 [Thermoleophilaceae bacterium]|nr:hypothetical protein [Thermoleophilaceae bacterium]